MSMKLESLSKEKTKMSTQDLKIETWPIERLIAYARNTRLHSYIGPPRTMTKWNLWSASNAVPAPADAETRNMSKRAKIAKNLSTIFGLESAA
jgi:hypothetical protein